MPLKLLSLSLALVGLSKAEKLAADCTNSTSKNCMHTGCCLVPGTKCFKKNKKWAACRTECTAGPHWDEPPYKGDPWECIELTGGCNKMHQPCGVRKGYVGTPCCEWGCSCNATKWGAACVPTKQSGEYTCNKANEESYSDDSVGQNFDTRKISNLPEAPGFTASLRLAGLVGLAVVSAAVAAGATLRVMRGRARSPQLASEVDEEVDQVLE
eukprot:CAMPEP_0113818760 /NCGR_PEP_ID=MMETSP0328-20130328/401_1 /TAXON_ID=39455 /ORGANISM="Alexandrium minutum" /LENGTH=211 /DNA_ID=CAMNT_0000786695 /DNA_START=82 /DNA_END=717 /DNA_ORIENTATION=+ /assembly_acc=CAM_ASM_000350